MTSSVDTSQMALQANAERLMGRQAARLDTQRDLLAAKQTEIELLTARVASLELELRRARAENGALQRSNQSYQEREQKLGTKNLRLQKEVARLSPYERRFLDMKEMLAILEIKAMSNLATQACFLEICKAGRVRVPTELQPLIAKLKEKVQQ